MYQKRCDYMREFTEQELVRRDKAKKLRELGYPVKTGIEVCNFQNQAKVKEILDKYDFDSDSNSNSNSFKYLENIEIKI